MRSVIFKILKKKTPFDGLVEHAEKVTPAVYKLKEAVIAYLDKDFSKFDELSDEIISLENEADWIKGGIRNHLPKGIYIPVPKGAFLSCLKHQDSIIDTCEDAVIWLQFRKSEITDELKGGLKKYLFKIIDIAQNVEVIVKDVHRLISSISLNERKKIKDKIKEIHFEEEETDKMEKNLIKEIFSTQGDALNTYHLIHVVFMLARIADHAENVGDYLRVMLAR
jgi:predicted phosphate transport protein (TIGR00153 family)